MRFEIIDSKGKPRTLLEWSTAAALAVGLVKVTTADGNTVEVDPAKVGAK